MSNKKNIFSLVTIVLLSTQLISCEKSPEQKTAAYFQTIQNSPQELSLFLDHMPKGGELHYHLSGGSYAKNLFQDGLLDHSLCLNLKTSAVYKNKQCPVNQQLATILQQPEYESVMNAWSMRNSLPYSIQGHEHFFNVFERIDPVVNESRAAILAEELNRAADQHEDYMELIVGLGNEKISELAQNIPWNSNYKSLEAQLDAAGLPAIISGVKKEAEAQDLLAKKIMHCTSPSEAQPGCKVQYRYLYYALRLQSPSIVFAQLYAGFQLANTDPRFVGINIVGAEDNPTALHDYKLHMQMIAYLYKQFPNVHMSLHAGELTRYLVPPEDLRFHVHDAVFVAHTDRLGHGSDIAHEADAADILKYMAAHHILDEVNLTSNAELLGVEGSRHPLPLFLKYGVPVALSTDDEGILRTDLTHEYVRAISTYNLTYEQIKNMARNVLSYSFLPGESLWNDFVSGVPVAVCQQSIADHQLLPSCETFLNENEKAKMQWQLEQEFWVFEAEKAKA